jgi:DNA-binding MltR family transcriptional regulator
MPNLKNQSEIDAYYLADKTHHRAAGVMWAALVDNRIDKLFEMALRPDKKVRDELFRAGGALGNYAVKVRLAYMLGWFGRDFYEDLLLISKIRNRFAHDIDAKDFADQSIDNWLKRMHVYRYLPGMLERARKRLETGQTVDSMASVLILEGNLEDAQSGFRYCIDMMLHYLDRCAENMRKNLANLREDWIVADPSSPN